jgi:peroxiredoxin
MFVVKVPEVTFKTRISIDEAPGFAWKDLTTRDVFAGKRVVLFSLPGAFTPTCSSTHLPGYEDAYEDILKEGIDEVYCLSVNDTFVMNSWMSSQGIEKVKPIPDGAGEFSRKMGFLVDKTNIGFGMRSWRYSTVINDGVVEQFFIEPGLGDNADGDPFEVSDAQTLLAYLQGVEVVSE